jgi:hypothetical protein
LIGLNASSSSCDSDSSLSFDGPAIALTGSGNRGRVNGAVDARNLDAELGLKDAFRRAGYGAYCVFEEIIGFG